MDKLERSTARRQAIAARYDRELADLPVKLPVRPEGRTHVYHQYTITLPADRDQIVEEMKQAGVSCGIYYPVPCHRSPYVLELGIEADLPVTEAVAASCLSLPVFPGLTEAEQGQVIAALRAAVARHPAA
jgi:dTDP-4-amino-4,6-dideoxygalactose transaminase